MDAIVPYNANIDAAVAHIAHIVNAISVHQARILRTHPTTIAMEAERRSTMSSLKGQLANVEGSVKSMKMAVVVGSVLTVACLAAVFGVTILANEVSKETKVSNGALVNRNGATVATATIEEVDLYDHMIANTLHVGSVIALPIEGGVV